MDSLVIVNPPESSPMAHESPAYTVIAGYRRGQHSHALHWSTAKLLTAG
jgi:hypothetical protein